MEIAVTDEHELRHFRLFTWYSNRLPVTAIFIYIGLAVTPGLALIDVFVDFPRGDQDWTIYLMYFPPIMLFFALVGLLADGFEKLLFINDKPDDQQSSDRVRYK